MWVGGRQPARRVCCAVVLWLLAVVCVWPLHTAAATMHRSHTPATAQPTGVSLLEMEEDKQDSDPVNQLVDHLMRGQVAKPQSLGPGMGAKVAVANGNEVHKQGHDGAMMDAQEEISREAAVKKEMEAAGKRHMEARAKITAEEREKKVDISLHHIKGEQKVKSFEDDLRAKDEMSRKKGKETMHKATERAQKQVEQVEREAMSMKEQVTRQEEIQKAEAKSNEETAKAAAELERKKAQEEMVKLDKDAHLKRKEDKIKFKGEVREKQRHEKLHKKKHEAKTKRKREEHDKHMTRQQERQAKHVNSQEKRFKRDQRRKSVGTRCHCRTQRVHFGHRNRWHLCPSGMLVTGLYRGRHHNLANIYYYRCCRPCKDDGREIIPVNKCSTANWVRSFDRAGWSYCPSSSYVQGFYKSSCNWIYCLEYARCCRIGESRGPSHCTRANWHHSLDRAGWSHLSPHYFLAGLYRSGGQRLYNIEYGRQCRFFVYSL